MQLLSTPSHLQILKAPSAADAKDWVCDVCSDTLPLCVRKECELMDERVKAGVEPLLLPVVAVYVSIECY